MSRASLRVAGVASTLAVRVPLDLLARVRRADRRGRVHRGVGRRGVGARAGGRLRRLSPSSSSAAPSVSMVISTFPTGQSCPSAYMRLATRPARGAGISTVALSVMISTIGWSSRSESPSLTSQRTTSPSTTPSPMSGSLNS